MNGLVDTILRPEPDVGVTSCTSDCPTWVDGGEPPRSTIPPGDGSPVIGGEIDVGGEFAVVIVNSPTSDIFSNTLITIERRNEANLQNDARFFLVC